MTSDSGIPRAIWHRHVEGRSHDEAVASIRAAIVEARKEGSTSDAADLEAALSDLNGVNAATTWDGDAT